MTNLVGQTKVISNSTGDIQHNVSANLVNTISNIAAYGRASVTRWDQTGDVLSFDIDTHDHREVACIAKTLAHWLAGKNQDIYVERFVSSDSTTIAIENPILKQPKMFGEVTDRQGNVRRRKQPRDPEINHHKWLFVEDDYEGFGVEASQQRSITWSALDDVDRSRIGKASYWNK